VSRLLISLISERKRAVSAVSSYSLRSARTPTPFSPLSKTISSPSRRSMCPNVIAMEEIRFVSQAAADTSVCREVFSKGDLKPLTTSIRPMCRPSRSKSFGSCSLCNSLV